MLRDESYQRRGMEVILPLPLIVTWLQEGGRTSGHKVFPRGRGRHALQIQGGKGESDHHILLLLLLLMMRVVMNHQRDEGEKIAKGATRHGKGHTSLKSSKRVGRISLSSPTMELLE